MTIGQNIRNIRKSRGLSQADFASQIGVSRPYLSELEHDKRNLGTNTLRRLAKKMNVSMLYLMEGGSDFSGLPDDVRTNLAQIEAEWVDDLQKGSEKKVLAFLNDPDYRDTPFRAETLVAMANTVKFAYLNKEEGLTDDNKKLRGLANLIDNINKMLEDKVERTPEALETTKQFIDFLTKKSDKRS